MEEHNSINVIERNGQLVVDSRLVSQELGIKHKNFLATVEKYKTEIESDFGQLLFETETVKNSVGAVNKTEFYYLNEDQATYLMTLSKNTARVRDCKRRLVKSFSKAKHLLQHQEAQQPQSGADMILAMAIEFKKHSDRLMNIEEENAKLRQQLAEQQETVESVAMLSEANSNELERFKNGHGYWYSIIGYATKYQLGSYSVKKASVLGRKATALCKQMGISPEKINDPRFGIVNTYPEHILAEVM